MKEEVVLGFGELTTDRRFTRTDISLDAMRVCSCSGGRFEAGGDGFAFPAVGFMCK